MGNPIPDRSMERVAGRPEALIDPVDATTDTLRVGFPLTERVLGRLGAPRWLWIGLWSAVPLLIPVALLITLALEGQSDRVTSDIDVIIPQLVLVYVVLLGLWGIGRLTSRAHALAPQLSRLTQETAHPQRAGRFDVTGPIALTIGITLVAFIGFIARFGPLAAVVIVPPVLLAMLPIMTFVWVYLEVLTGLDRLGQKRLALDPFPQDTTLGLGPVGSLAFTGLALLLAGALPVSVSNTDDLASVALSLGFLGVSVAVFFLSMWRIHRQMAAAKARYLAETQAAYAAAYEPYRQTRSLATLEEQAPVLGIAHALDERAHQIREWPIDQRLVRIMGFTFAALASAIIARFVLIVATS